MAIVEMQNNGQGVLTIGWRMIQPGSTFYIDDREIAEYISPMLIQSGVITYVDNSGSGGTNLPAGTISANLVIMQQQQAISAVDVQDAMVQISSFMISASGTLNTLGETLGVVQQQQTGDQLNISQLTTEVGSLTSQVTANTGNITTNTANITTLTNDLSNQEVTISHISSQLSTALFTPLFEIDVNFPSGTTSVVLTHNVGSLNYAVMITPTSNPGSGTFWVAKELDTMVINFINAAPEVTATIDVVVLT